MAVYSQLGARRLILLVVSAAIVYLLYFAGTGSYFSNLRLDHVTQEDPVPAADKAPTDAAPPIERPIYKPIKEKPPPISDNFPLAVSAKQSSDLPPVPSWNRPSNQDGPQRTPLFIGFTRNWPLLQQTVVSYITSGWPAQDIHVVENTGAMRANFDGALSMQNPFFLDYERLTKILGVNVIRTPTLLSFAQLQNFYTSTAIENSWKYYYWSHMDVVALSNEEYVDEASNEYKSLYQRVVDDLRTTLSPSFAPPDRLLNDTKLPSVPGRWALRFYAYDRLTLMNVRALEDIGGWDTMIPYYGTDCDMYERFTMNGWSQGESKVGLIYDIGSSLEDLHVLYRRDPKNSNTEDERASAEWVRLRDELNTMQHEKNTDKRGRNFWQGSQAGGQGEPYYRDGDGFEKALKMTIEHGGKVMTEKWGTHGCGLRSAGLKAGDEWRVEHDWEPPPPKPDAAKGE